MNWIFEIYGDTYKALTLLPSSSPRLSSLAYAHILVDPRAGN